MYTEYSTAEQRVAPQENISRQSAPARRAAPRRRRSRRYDRRRVLLIGMALVLFLGGFISGCCVGRAHNRSGGESSANDGSVSAKPQKSNIPASITLPNYVKEDLLPVNEYSRCGDKLQRVNAVVIHYVGNPNTTAWQNRSYFANLATTGETSASSNLIVGLEGEALLCVPLDEVAYCSNDRNHDTISIECCHTYETGKFYDSTYQTLVNLCAYLCVEFDLKPDDIIRHYDVTGKICPKYFVDHPEEWETFHKDVKNAIRILKK